jgi:formylglycine-generating enzyme required for sulfatase activity
VTSKFALVIANTEYQDASFAKLTAPGKDAEEFAQVLREPELAAFDDVQVLLNDGESKIRRSIARFFAERKRDHLLLLYFSGHGIRNGQGQLFLAANDTEISILEATGIPAEFVTYAMNNSRSQRQLLILDCCNSGAFAHGSKSASAVGKSMGIATAFEGSGFGRVVLTATDATQYAWEGDKVIGNTQKSVFTHFLIEGLKGEADRDGDGRIHVDELYDYAYEQVVRRTPKQTPGKWSYKQQGDIVLRENLKPRDVKPAPLPPDLLELLSHPNSGVRKVGVQDLISLLEGKHLGLTRAAEEKLREIAVNDDSFTLRKTASETLVAHGLAVEEPTPPVITPPIVPVETTVSNEQKSDLEKLSSQAIQYELKGDFWNALQTYYKIKRIDPLFPRVDIKIQELEREQRPKPVPVPASGNLNAIPWRLLGFAVGGLLVIVFLIWGASKLLGNFPTGTSEPTYALQTTVTFASLPSTMTTSQPERTNTPSPTQTSIPPPQTGLTQTSGLGIGSMLTGKDGMTLLYVPAGEFKMGTNYGDPQEEPLHTIYLDAFWIDRTEVTNAMYVKCMQNRACNQPSQTASVTHASYYGNPDFDNYPAIYVSWNDAKAYCSWADRRLPTEAEWEKAARGDDARNYPWGNSAPEEGFLNGDGVVGDTTKVGNYPSGISPYGALDMAGNVSEWVADWYRELYYASQPKSNPPGPQQGSARVIRGGSWAVNICRNIYSGHQYECPLNSVYTWRRKWDVPGIANQYYGFRCAVSVSP